MGRRMTLTDGLVALHHAGRIASPWAAGLRVEIGPDGVLRIDTSDPSSIGCLAAKAREASGDPLMLPRVEFGHPATGRRWDDEQHRWCIPIVRDDVWTWHCEPTEGGAWEAVIIALAREPAGLGLWRAYDVGGRPVDDPERGDVFIRDGERGGITIERTPLDWIVSAGGRKTRIVAEDAEAAMRIADGFARDVAP